MSLKNCSWHIFARCSNHKQGKMLLISIPITEVSNQLCWSISMVGDDSSAAKPVLHVVYSQSITSCIWGPSLPSIQYITQRQITELQHVSVTSSCTEQNLSPLTWHISHLVRCLLPITDLERPGMWPKMPISHSHRRQFLRNLSIGAPGRVAPHRQRLRDSDFHLSCT